MLNRRTGQVTEYLENYLELQLSFFQLVAFGLLCMILNCLRLFQWSAYQQFSFYHLLKHISSILINQSKTFIN